MEDVAVAQDGAAVAAGGADPVSAVANALGAIIPAMYGPDGFYQKVGDYLFGAERDRKRAALNVPQYKWFYSYEGKTDNTGLIIIGVMAAVLVIVVLATVLKAKRG